MLFIYVSLYNFIKSYFLLYNFFFFCTLTLYFAFVCVTSKNIIEVLFGLICIFLFSSGCLFCIKAEFLAVIFVMVYVGAIMVLFLFAIMLLNFREQAAEVSNSMLFYLVTISFFLLVHFFELQYIN